MTLEEGSELSRFLTLWNTRKSALDSQLSSITNAEEIPEARKSYADLHKFYNDATLFLRTYDKKICQSALNELQSRIIELDVRLNPPKRKFGFKTRAKAPVQPEISNKFTPAKVNVLQDQSDGFLGFVLSEKTDETIELLDTDVNGRDVLLTRLSNCHVQICGSPATLHVTDARHCTISCGPVASSVFVDHANQSRFEFACQQLRIHQSQDVKLFIHVQSRPIIEDSSEIQFGVYSFSYEKLKEHFRVAGLDPARNLWRHVDDFNWLNTEMPSPNFSFLQVEDNGEETQKT